VEGILAALGIYSWMGKSTWPQMVVLIVTLLGIQACLIALEWIENKLCNRK
jgi:hypothetical protein